MSIRIGNTIVAGMPEKAMRGVGDIFTTTNKGVIAGAVEANGGSYNIADYNSGTDSVASKLTAGTLPYVSKAEFQTQVANTGACDSFGWNGATDTLYAWTAASVTRAAQPVSEETYYTKSTTPAVGDNLYYAAGSVSPAKIVEVASDYSYIVTDIDEGYYNHIRDASKDIAGTSDPTFLVPKLNPWHIGKNAPVIGNGLTLGLTDGTDNYGLQGTSVDSLSTGKGAYGTAVGTATGTINAPNKNLGVTTDGTKSGVVADLSENTNLRVMVQLATGATDQALETCTGVLSDVSALKNASNFTATGKATIVGFSIPDYSAGVTVTSPFTAPSAGLIAGYWNGNGNIAYVNGAIVGATPSNNGIGSLQIVVGSGDVLTIASGASNVNMHFYPFKGA